MSAPRPAILPADLAGIPQIFRDAPAWVGYRLISVPGRNGPRWTKLPINIRTGKRASASDRSTWVDYETAMRDYRRRGCDGVGMCRTGDWLFVDMDGCLTDDGRLLDYPW